MTAGPIPSRYPIDRSRGERKHIRPKKPNLLCNEPQRFGAETDIQEGNSANQPRCTPAYITGGPVVVAVFPGETRRDVLL